MGLIEWIALLSLAAGPSPEGRPETFDCGPMALSILLRLEGMPGDPRSVAANLSPRPSGGYSMLELREAARGLELSMTGARIGRGDSAPDRPILALLDKKPEGHFVVVRPVGQTGKLVQVIDPTGRLEVLDASALYAAPEWTGLALIPSRPNWPLRVGIALGVVSSLAFARLLVITLRRPGTGGWRPS